MRLHQHPVHAFIWPLFYVSIFALLPFPSLAQSPSSMSTMDMKVRIGHVVEKANSGGLHSGEIVLSDQSGIRVDQAFGIADKNNARAHIVGENWLWASVTKQITAVLVMQFVEEGKLSLARTIKDYLPEFQNVFAGQIMLKQLLQHTSGLPNPDDTKPDENGIPAFYHITSTEPDIFSQVYGFCSGASKSKPDEKFEYNNCDYLVLGNILEKLTGKSFDELVFERISKPLGLQSVGVFHDNISNRAIGYTTDGKPYPPISIKAFAAAGALTGSAEDLVKFDIGLLGGKLMNRESLTLLWQGDPKLGYEALGVWSYPAQLSGCEKPVQLVERRGDVAGIQVRNVISPDLGRAIALFTNDDTIDFGEVWQSKGLLYDVLSEAFCSAR